MCPKVMIEAINRLNSSSINVNTVSNSIILKVSCLEIYLNECFDLLNNKQKIPIAGYKNIGMGSLKGTVEKMDVRMPDGRRLDDRHPDAVAYLKQKQQEFLAQGTTEFNIKNVDDITNIMKIIEVTRSAKSHKLNDRSSRSHCIVTLNMTNNANGRLVSSKFTFCDLAGSERVKKTHIGGVESIDMQAAEARNINTSLTTLGRVILAMKKKDNLVPFRESALTMLMKDSLTGNCRTSLIITVAENPEMIHESISSMRFGMTCGALKNEVSKKEVDVDSTLKSLKSNLSKLDKELNDMVKAGQGGCLNPDEGQALKNGFIENFKKLLNEERNYINAKENKSKVTQNSTTNTTSNKESAEKKIAH